MGQENARGHGVPVQETRASRPRANGAGQQPYREYGIDGTLARTRPEMVCSMVEGEKLEENHDAGRALESDEEAAILKAAAANRSKMLYPFLMTLVWTGMRSDEARTLRWSQVDFEAGELVIGKAKTEAGTRRVIPMSGALWAALEHHAAFCASKLGPIQAEWYVFPLSNRTRPVDPRRPVTSFMRGWEIVRGKGRGEMLAARLAAFVLHQAGRSRWSRRARCLI
jgi:integrase